ncbi:DUF28 domain protein [Neohortaea acidophila]|uniref:DUF28 domain protein n=1 Tax=Neohortaea acidophila TaxID=245834 RepID=A0A6A6PHY1_9PEZI|nr:DUF28 domain protein [Neohortaea acidophila]KAF2478877.1 DUF28 domain protein [Neohortaea acidophila]
MAPSRGITSVAMMATSSSLRYQTCSLRPLSFLRSEWITASSSRTFITTSPYQSGHNRWSKIKHDKQKVDAAKNRQRSLFAHEIAHASKYYGADPNSNPRLADIITKAKREGFAKASIEAAIARGQGKSTSGQKLENVTIEGILPGNIGVVIECETDSKARTMMELRHVLKDAGGTATPSAYLFEKKGKLVFEGAPGKGLEQVMDVALDAGVEDIEEAEDGEITLLCEPSDTNAVSQAITNAFGLEMKSSEISWIPIKETAVEVTDAATVEGLDAFMEVVQEKESSATVAMNIA